MGTVWNMRLFVAINFNNDTRSKLVAIQNELRSRSVRGNFTLAENLHLTLAFIGEVAPKKADKVKTILETVSFAPFDIEVDRLGTFSNNSLWWVGLRESQPLMDLQREIEHKLALGGFVMDGREYRPHITIARKVETDGTPWVIKPFGETVSGISLMKSERFDGRLAYTEIYSKKCGG
jgi:2'-5' RNA ligase